MAEMKHVGLNVAADPFMNSALVGVHGGLVVAVADADRLAHEAGLPRATNMVVAGAASRRLPIGVETMETFITTRFASKGEKVVEQNLRAFRAGREAHA
jgi:Pyruvate/2-oxoacid:ferredoxin oxidoreductase gamma subunit